MQDVILSIAIAIAFKNLTNLIWHAHALALYRSIHAFHVRLFFQMYHQFYDVHYVIAIDVHSQVGMKLAFDCRITTSSIQFICVSYDVIGHANANIVIRAQSLVLHALYKSILKATNGK